MKCSLKDGFINILLLICITPTRGIEFPLFLHKSSVPDKPMNLQQFRASINRLQDLDSFPDNGDNRLHKIVKKQMATCDCRDARKSKRSTAGFPGRPSGFRWGAGDAADIKYKVDDKPDKLVNISDVFKSTSVADSTESSGSFLKKLKDFAREKDLLFLKRTKKNDPPNKIQQIKEEALKKEKDVQDIFRRLKDKLTGKDPVKEDKPEKVEQDQPGENSCLAKHYTRFPDKYDYRYYYECESHPNGCLKLRHKRCPQGQFFSFKYLKCLKVPNKRRKKSSSDSPCPKKFDFPETGPDDSEPANEWLDATQGANKIPSEFKPKKKPGLKIYHLRGKRRLGGTLRGEITESRHFGTVHGTVKKHGSRHHLPRSYLIRVKKKEADDQITENDENENDNDEDDEETDEEYEEDEADDEDDDGEEDESKDAVQEKPAGKESFRDLLKSAKAAVTSRARFEDPLETAGKVSSTAKTTASSSKSKKSNDSTVKEDKRVLIDANIKVDSTISSVLKNLLKSKRKDREAVTGAADDYETLAGLGSCDPEATALYEHLMQNNPRVKRYFLANCAQREN